MTYEDFKPPRIKGIGPAVGILIQLQEGASSVMGLTDITHSSALNNCVKAELVLCEVREEGRPATYSITEKGVRYLEDLHPR